MDCPKCQGVASNMTPIKNHDDSMAVFGCQSCGHSFNAKGEPFVSDTEKLRDVFRGATMANQTLMEAFGGDKMPPAQKTYLMARLMEYGLQMWFDGVKQGLLLGATKEAANGQVRS